MSGTAWTSPVVAGSRVRPDRSWRGRRIAVFLDGCFWHACPIHQHWPKANAHWWRDKIEANVARDRRADALLRSLDWTVLRFWEHEEPAAVAAAVRSTLADKRAATCGPRDTEVTGPAGGALP